MTCVPLSLAEHGVGISVADGLGVLVPRESELRAQQGLLAALERRAFARRSETAAALGARGRHRSLSV